MAVRATRFDGPDSNVSLLDVAGAPLSAQEGVSAVDLWAHYAQLRRLQRDDDVDPTA